MRIVYSRASLDDIVGVGEYLRQQSTTGAAKVREAIQSAISRLADHPRSGRLQDDGSRKIVTKRYGYLIYYDVKIDIVEILTIQHGARHRARKDA